MALMSLGDGIDDVMVTQWTIKLAVKRKEIMKYEATKSRVKL